jgi:hypothetical protein
VLGLNAEALQTALRKASPDEVAALSRALLAYAALDGRLVVLDAPNWPRPYLARPHAAWFTLRPGGPAGEDILAFWRGYTSRRGS